MLNILPEVSQRYEVLSISDKSGVYTGDLAEQIRQANGRISVHDMHSEAVAAMYGKHGPSQTAVYSDTLQRKLLMPGKM